MENPNQSGFDRLNIALVFYVWSQLGLGNTFYTYDIRDIFALLKKYEK